MTQEISEQSQNLQKAIDEVKKTKDTFAEDVKKLVDPRVKELEEKIENSKK